MQTLLEKAKEIKKKKDEFKLSDEFEELILAWVNDEIKLVQIAKAINLKSASTVYSLAAIVLKKYINNQKKNNQ